MWSDAGNPVLEYRYLDQSLKRVGFSCRNREIDSWFAHRALKAHMEGSIVVVCATLPAHSDRPVGFYAPSTVAEEVVRTFAMVGPQIGLPALIVMPHPEDYARLKLFYQGLDFREYVGGGTMFLPLQLALAAQAQRDDASMNE